MAQLAAADRAALHGKVVLIGSQWLCCRSGDAMTRAEQWRFASQALASQ